MALIFLIILVHCETALAFVNRQVGSVAFRTITTSGKRQSFHNHQHHHHHHHLCMTADNPFATEAATAQNAEVKDKSGNVFQVGGIVRIVRENLKAYQVPPKGYGSFDSDKKFVPILSENDAPPSRSKKNLVLPVGMRGTITKIYERKDISANLPVQVKFTPGENLDEGYDPPVPFSMHFQPMEVECV
jgi:hypothetical protein